MLTSDSDVEGIGAGGLSGQPLHSRSLEVVQLLYQHLRGDIPIIGVGGIMNGTDAWNMIGAGANLIQLYTGFVYGGPAIIRDINREILTQMESHGFSDLTAAIGHAS